MNGELALLDERVAFRLYLARRGVPTWSLDYRNHFVPPTLDDLQFMSGWTGAVFLDDARAALALMRNASTAPIAVAGFSRGASFACALASDPANAIAGLIILDGVAPGTLRSARPPGPVAVDVGGRRLTYERRAALLDRVIENPSAPPTHGAFATAADQLAHVLYSSKTFGGRGGLSNAKNGKADIQTVARLLASYDRYWPGAARPEAVPATAPPPNLAVFAAASTNMGRRFTEAVVGSARNLGGDGARIVVLDDSGHLDVLVGTDAHDSVFGPLLEWVNRLSAFAEGQG